MALTTQQEKMLLLVLGVTFTGLVLYRIFSVDATRTVPLAYTPGMKVASAVRRGLQQPGTGQNALSVFLSRRVERYPGMARDLFRVSRPKPVVVAKPVVVETAPTPTVPVKSPEEIAADAARADLATFRFLGYLTDKDSSLFLSKGGELFIAKSGDTVLKSYQIKSAGKDHVILYDTATKVEVRIDLTGSEGARK
jgi:hypothetical protein